MEFDQFLAGGIQSTRVLFAGGVDEFVKALHFGDGIAGEGGGIEVGFPAQEQFSELRAPVAQMIVGDDAVSEQARNACEGIAENGRANVADMHGLGGVGGTEINDDGAGAAGFVHQRALAARHTLEGEREGGDFEAEIEKAGAGNFGRFGPFGNVEAGGDIGGELAGIDLAGLGQGDEGAGLVIAEAGVGAGADADGGGIGVGEDGGKGLLEALFKESVEHGGDCGLRIADCGFRGWPRIGGVWSAAIEGVGPRISQRGEAQPKEGV